MGNPGEPNVARLDASSGSGDNGMTERAPATTKNLDIYGHAPLEWRRATEHLASDTPMIETAVYLGTVGRDGHPHSAGVGAAYHDGDVYFTTSPKAHKAQHLATNPNCTFSFRLKGLDLVLEGTAARTTDRMTLEAVLKIFNDGGWPATLAADGDAFTADYSGPWGGPPPWLVFGFRFHTAMAVASEEPHGATLWKFAG
jgi:hypothetical protein